MKTTTTLMLVASVISMTVDDCSENQPDREMAEETQQIMGEAHSRIGLPSIQNFTERRFAKMLFELRDTEVATYTYIVDMNGQFHFICESIGYGIPYSVQYTNPERRAYRTSGYTLPQADPNGLFMPQGLAATFVMCSDPNGDGLRPIYVEPEIVVSPFEL